MTDLNFFISAAPESAAAFSSGVRVSLAAFRVGRDFRLVYPPLPRMRPALMEVDMTSFTGYGPHRALSFELVRRCRLLGCRGLVLRLPRPTPQTAAFCETLSFDLVPHGLTLYLPEAYGRAVPAARLLLPSICLSADFETYLQRRADRYGPDRLALCLDLGAYDFALPSLTGMGSPLAPRSMALMPLEKFFYSPHFYMSCSSCVIHGQAHLVFVEDEKSAANKVRLAKSMSVPDVFLPQKISRDLLNALENI